MQFFPSQFTHFVRSRSTVRNFKILIRFIIVLVILIIIYSILFHYIMAAEGQDFSWITGFYWTLTVMSTLGFGDITFHTDLGRIFSIVVLVSGVFFLLILLPFTFIQFFYAPWMEAQNASRAPRKLPEGTTGHVIITHYGPVTRHLIKKLKQYNYSYVVLCPDLEEALKLSDMDVRVVVGDLDDPETYRKISIESAAMVVTTRSDIVNTNVVSTIRSISETVPIISTVTDPASIDILELAGSTHVLRLDEMMGQFLARRTTGGNSMAHKIGQFDSLLIAEANVAGTPLVGKTLKESKLRQLTGLTISGAWDRGEFKTARPEMKITPNTVLVLAGSEPEIRKYDELFCIYNTNLEPVVVIGGGKVGTATSLALEKREIDYRVVERNPELVPDDDRFILGNAADLEILEKAGIMKAPTAIITTHDDDTNIYLVIYCRRLRPDIQIISRATLDRNVTTLHRAGADFVLSYESMGANTMFNLLNRSDILMLTEGLDVFKVKLPSSLIGKTLAESGIRSKTGCSVVGLVSEEKTQFELDPYSPLSANTEIILIGSIADENRFLDIFGNS
ncbi:MAG: NAD-binding protein [Ignavibacteria bacterium]|nr:NAD-binding protein [Ignavibacteria bacterium]MBT8381887.1 NAD-binding protein [Ignavibacteria bacterium]MBT8391065.1 NAD-binding protein [Ignavibacteria bacterium]NNJ54460.1 potassium channel protein [Ignavibacteriaceae bacterium]NNL21851.1 potassium channel protein [Ignavibacteriaceae bacterium]